MAILGPVGDNFGAGMTGGRAYIWDPKNQFEAVANPDAISWHSLASLPNEHAERFKLLLELHVERTGSVRAADLLAEFEETCAQTLLIVPDEVAESIIGTGASKVAAE